METGVSYSTLYLNFEDERLENFCADDFNRLLECHQEMYGKRPMLFLDEIQNIDGWHKFARRMADSQYTIFITGSNAKMLSGEINTYEIIRHGKHKLLHQTPWYDDEGNVAGLVELAIDLPDNMPVFDRDQKKP